MMIIILLILSVLIGVFLGKFLGNKEKLAKNLLILSAGFLITICINEIFPEIYHSGNQDIGYWILVGVILQMILENLTKGFEHGHFHHHSENKKILPLALIIGMFVHAFIEGIPLAKEKNLLSAYLIGILFHNLPISFVLGAYLFESNQSKKYAWPVILLFALASPIGSIFGQYFNEKWQPYFLSLVGGIFLHISSVIIFESNQKHKMEWKKLFLVLSGIAIALFGHLFHHH